MREWIEGVLLSDEPGAIREAAAQGHPTVYSEHAGAESVFEADMTVLDTGELDRRFFRRVYERHFHLPWIIAETERLLIRESTEEDFDGLRELYRDAKESWFDGTAGMDLSGEPEEARERFRAYITHQYPFFGYGLYSVLERETGRLVGRIGFGTRELDGAVFPELGYLVGAEFRGRGIASEAALALASELEELTGETEAVILCRRENRASIRTAERLCRMRPETYRLLVVDE